MKYAFRILLALLLCVSAGLVFVILLEPHKSPQLVGGSPEVACMGREVPLPVEEPLPPQESPLSPVTPPAEPETSPAETEVPPAAPSLPPEGEQSPPPTAEEGPSAPAEVVSPPAEEPPAPAPESPAPAQAEPIPPQEPEAWMLRLVNWENPLPVGFEPEYEAIQNRFVMDKRVATIARQMIADAQAQGVTLVVNSAYRPYSAQQQVYNAWFQKYLAEGRTEQEARRLTESYVAVPGYSEHQLGLAMDIVAVANGERVDSWLVDHAPEYGFILRYPEGKTSITHTAYESWHYRYVGVPTAREITDRGLCLEEYLAAQ